MDTPLDLSRRSMLGLGGFGLSAALISLAGCAPSSSSASGGSTQNSGLPKEVRYAQIGEGKAEPGTVLRNNLGGFNGKQLLQGVDITWQPGFTASLPVMEAIKAGSIDFTFATATAVVYGIGGGVPIVPLAAYPLPRNEVDIIVPKDSPIKTVADLKGKKVADQQGTTSTYSLIKTLEAAGLTMEDIDHKNMPAADAAAAFAQGSVDAWISWQPAIELGRRRNDARALPGVNTYDYAYFVASEDFAYKHGATAARLVRALRDAQRWIEANPDEAVEAFAGIGGFGNKQDERQVYLDLVKAKRLSYSGSGDLTAVSQDSVASTQEMADSFHKLGIYPKQVDVTKWFANDKFTAVQELVKKELSA